jgi:hypothetical protein
MKRYFTMMMDGTYALTGSAEAFQELVHKQGIAMYQENIQKNHQLKCESIANGYLPT